MSCIQPIIKKVKRFLSMLLPVQLLFICCLESKGQSKWVIENYNYIGQPGPGSVVPMLHFETKKNWYGELRYNYEDNQTISFFGGKTFKGDNKFSYAVTPLIGFSAGNFNGISAGINTDISWKKIYISSQSQYSAATKGDCSDFFFSWSEIGYSISSHFFAGVAMQTTRQKNYKKFEPGFVAGFEIKNFSFPFYIFSPLTHDCYAVVGINYSYQFTGNRKVRE